MTGFQGMTLTTQEVINFLRRDLRMKEIRRVILAQKIIDRTAEEAEIVVDTHEVQLELDRIRYEQRFDHPAQLLTWATSHLTTLSEVEKRIREKLIAKKLAYHLFLDRVHEQFQHGNADFEQLSIYEIRVPYETLAREIFYQIEEEEISFFEAAHIYDIDEARRLVCGFAGRQLRSQLTPELALNLRNAQVGQVVGPIQVASDRFVLLLVDDLTAPALTPEITDTLIDSMFQDWLQEKLSAYINLVQGE